MSSRRLPPRSSTTLDPKTPTPSSSSQQIVSELSDQLTPRLSTRTTTRSGQTPSASSTSRRPSTRTPAAVASTSKLTREGVSTGTVTGKGKGRAAELRTEDGGGGGGEREGEGGRRSTPSHPRRAAQPSTSTPVVVPPPQSIQRQTRSQSTLSIPTSSEQEEVSQSEDDEEEPEPNERESAFQAAASALHDFYISAPAGRGVDRPTEELLFNVLTSHKSFLFPSLSTPSYILPSTLPRTTSPYLRSAVALANKATLLHAVLLPSTAGREKERVDAFEEAWEAFVQVWAADKEEGLQVHDGVLVMMVDFGTQLYILKNPGNLNASDRESLLWDYFSSTLLSRQGVLSVDREDGLRSQLQLRWKSLSQERVRKLQNTPTTDLPTTFSYFDFERELINSCRARRRLDSRGGGGSSLLLEEEEHQVPLREEEEQRPIKRARKSEPAPPRRLTTSTSLSVSARKPSTTNTAAAAASRRRSLPTNLAATSSNASTFQLGSPRAPQGSYPLPVPPASSRRSSGPRYSVLPVRQEDLTSGSESEASANASGDEPEDAEEEKDASSSASGDEPEPEPEEEVVVVGAETPSSSGEEESGSEESASASEEETGSEEEEDDDEEEDVGEGEATPRPPRRVVAEVEVVEENEEGSEEEESDSEGEEGLEETEELVGLEEDEDELDEEEPGVGVGAREEMEVDGEEEDLVAEEEENEVLVEDEGVVIEVGGEEDVEMVRDDPGESVLAVDLGEEDWDALMAQAAERDVLRRLSLPPSERNPSLPPLDKGKGRAEPRLPFVAAPAPVLDDYNDMNDNDFQPYDPQPSPPPQRLTSSSTRQSKPHPQPKKPRPSKRQNTFDDDPSDDDDDAAGPTQGLKKTSFPTRTLPSAPSTSAWALPTDRRRPSAASSSNSHVNKASFPPRIRHRSISSSIDPMLIEQRVLARKEREREAEEERRRVEEERRAEYFGDGHRGKSRERGDELEDRGTGGYWDQQELAFFLEEAMMLSPRETQPWDKLISLYGPNGTENTNLRRRTNVNLKDKMRNYLHANYPSSGTKPVLGTLMRFLSRDDPRRIAWLEEEEKKKNPELPALWQKKKSGGQPRKSTRWKGKGKGKKKEVTVRGVVDSDEEEGNELEDVEEEEEEEGEAVEGMEEEDGDEGEEEVVEEMEEEEVPRRRTKRATAARKGVVAS